MNPAESMKNSCYIWNVLVLHNRWRSRIEDKISSKLLELGYKSSHFSLVICFVTHYKWSEFDHFSSRLSHFLTESHYRKNCSNASYFLSFFFFILKIYEEKLQKSLNVRCTRTGSTIIILSETDLPLELGNYRYFNFR